MTRTTTAVVGASGLALAALFTYSTATAALADPDRAPRSDQVPDMDRMHELMTDGNSGMDRMHELMTEGPR
ncbi:MAG: hypothetical protein KY451_03830 [Actinobacteria bacterium]|nr:hypothetical protein [Actinomycetota bacterium]MBW3646721.1 hypothetical protein [Actinomycetota bacterium]